MKYEHATWRIRVGDDQYVELSIKGNGTALETSSPRDVIRAANIMKEVGRSLDRIATRWAQVEAAKDQP